MFKYITDIHLDINPIPAEIPREEGVVLLIPGDLCEIRTLTKPGGIAQLERICAAYDKVVAICGNHEFYGEHLYEGVEKYRELTRHIENFIILDNETLDIGEYRIIGTTLWTDMNNRDPMVMHAIKYALNDYVYIHKDNPYHAEQLAAGAKYETTMTKVRIIPADTCDLFEQAVEFIMVEILRAEIDNKKIILMTHHAPMLEHCNDQRHIPNNAVNFAYATDLGDLFENYGINIHAAIHGHTHDIKLTYINNDIPLQTYARGYYEKPFTPKEVVFKNV